MQITFVLPGIDISGGVRSTLELANRLYQRGHQVVVVFSSSAWQLESKKLSLKQLIKAALKHIRNSKRLCSLDWFDLKARLLCVPSLAEKYIPNGDVIIATWWGNTYDVSRYGKSKGIKFHFIRAYETWCGPEELVDKCYTLNLHKIATIPKLKEFIENKFDIKVHGPLPNGINFDLFHRESKDFKCHTPKRLGILYRRDKVKGMQDGFEAVIKAQQKFPEMQVVLFGEPFTKEDSDIIKKINNVEIHKLSYGQELRRIYNSLDIFVFPSHYEAATQPPLEAMACGVACVLTEVGAISDYNAENCVALISPPKKPEELYENIVTLLADEQSREKIAREGHKFSQQFTWDKTVLELEKLFKKYA